ncbi:hypothetical protein D5086_026881 [Populus alba]|uniref:Uncharacterized protein n=1 Tax=Populus alba TaxID=43335 RepID=A0ACC4B4K8_POPAL|nr:uncharacterized protein LOC118049501 [Populus alba]
MWNRPGMSFCSGSNDSLFVQFDHDLNGTVDLEEFKAETKQMMLAMASGMGFLPVQMVLEEDSFLKKAVEWESAKLVASYSPCPNYSHPITLCGKYLKSKPHQNRSSEFCFSGMEMVKHSIRRGKQLMLIRSGELMRIAEIIENLNK